MFHIKIGNKRVAELKQEANRVGIRGYSRLQKAKLIDLSNKNRNKFSIKKVAEINYPLLRPPRYMGQGPPEIKTNDGSDKRKEIRELETLGLRIKGTSWVSEDQNIPMIKITDHEEVQREIKINRIKEIVDCAPNSGSLRWQARYVASVARTQRAHA